MTKILDRPEAFDVDPISFRHSLTTHTLISMGIRVTLVVFAVSILSYWHIVQTLENQTYDKLAKYIQERGEKESIIFEQAEANQQVFKQQFLLLNDNSKNIPVAEFDQLFEKTADGTTRMRKALFEGVVGHNGMISRHNSAFIGAAAPLDNQPFRDRLVNAYRLLDRFGPTYRTLFENVYASFPENAIIVHWQEQAWGTDAQTDMNVHEEEWFYVADKINNPSRQTVWTGSYYDDTAKKWMVSCETPIDHQGQHLLTVGHDYLLNTLFERVFNDKLEGTYNYIFREDGLLIAHPDKVDLLSQVGGVLNIADMNDPQLLSQYQQVLSNIKGLDTNTKVFVNDEQDAFIAVSKIKGPDWWFVTYFPKQLLSSTALDAAKFIFILSVISLIVELVMLFFVLRYKVVGPLKMFVAASTQVTQGHYDEVASGALHLPEKRNDEVGLLARMLRIMAGRINNNIEEMKHLDQLKDDILANTSHELRTPLNGIVGIAESMLDGAAGQLSDRQAYNLKLVVTSGQRLTNLVNDILDFSKLKHHELDLQIKPLNISAVVGIVVDLSQPLLNKDKLTLVNRMDDDVPGVYADENRVQQILYNLIGNAIKFTEQGTVVVSSKVQEDHLVITVSDSGIGIAPSKLGSIFKSFEQADGSTARSYGGTGLGLSVTKQLVELHNGQIWVESSEGQGTGFSFTLPVCDGEVLAEPIVNNKPNQTDQLNQGKQPSAQNMFENELLESSSDDAPQLQDSEADAGRILIVDDEPINLQVLQNHLSLKNYQVTTAANGKEAIEAIESEQKFDAVLLDVMMPGMTGFEVCRQIRKKYPTNRLPVLMVTAKNRIGDLSASFGAGANDFLTKPVAKAELLERLKTQISVVRLN
ncbi:MAG: ATP-binding protein, partial [Psychrosphaera sp.]|nr:ATP-binding protein [Psychrosphaera sp.]